MARPREFDETAVLDRAVQAFWQHGFDGIAVQDLCTKLRLNPGSLYGAFGDKRALFLAALDRYIDTVSRQAVVRIGGGRSGMDGIRSFFEFLIDAIVSGKRRWGCLVTNAIAEHADRDREVAARTRSQLLRLEDAFAGALARAQAGGEIPQGDHRAQAALLVCIVQGMNVLAKSRPNRLTLQRIVEAALAGVARPPQGATASRKHHRRRRTVPAPGGAVAIANISGSRRVLQRP